jgi:prepilin-type N-terminal cleavage/methylation domain-containing protein
MYPVGQVSDAYPNSFSVLRRITKLSSAGPHMALNTGIRRSPPLGQSGSSRRRPRRGFTLLELILVLALMVAIVSLAGTNLRSGFRHQRLRKAAEQVRTEWARARIEAIKRGRVHVFYHTQQGNQYVTMPQASLDDLPPEWIGGTNPSMGTSLAGSRSPTGSTSFAGGAGSLRQPSAGFGTLNDPWQQELLGQVRQRELPTGVWFLGADVQFDQRSMIQLNQTSDPTAFGQSTAGFGPDLTNAEQWGMPIFFFPDGTTSTAQLVLMNDHQEAMRIYLRGLTGLVRVGGLERTDVSALQEVAR